MGEEFEFTPGVRENVHLVLALAGASGSGKTKSALEIAAGICEVSGGEIFFADTESRRALHYANGPHESDPSKYKFRHLDMLPPFRPQRFEDVILAAENAGAGCLIIDSFSHEYDGEGGIMDWAADLESGILKPGRTMADTEGPDGWKAWASKPVKSPGNWKEPKSAHKHLVQTSVLQARCHVIFCLRAEEKIRILKAGDPLDPKSPDGEKARTTVVQPMGWMPICEKRFMYEMTMSLTLRPDMPGRPDFSLPHKVQDQHRHFLQPGEYITRDVGRRLAEWAQGGAKGPPPKAEPIDADAYMRRASAAFSRADDTSALRTWWNSDKEKAVREAAALSTEQTKKLASILTARLAELEQRETEHEHSD